MNFNISKIKELEAELNKRLAALVKSMHGSDLPADGEQMYADKKAIRHVDGTAVRLAADDFTTVIREIKKTLGK